MDNGYGNNNQNGYGQQTNNNYNPNMGYEQQGMNYQQNDGYQQQNMNYQQNNQYGQAQKTPRENRVYNNALNVTGDTGVNLMVFVMLASIFLMTRNTTAMMITIAVAFVLEKNKKLWEVLVTTLITLAAIVIAYDILILLIQPISSLGYWLADIGDYSGFIYEVGKFLYESTSKIRSFIGWVYDIGAIVLGILTFTSVSKGKFKTPKFLKKYFE